MEEETAEKVRAAGGAMQGCGCLLTLLVTVPFLLLVCFGV